MADEEMSTGREGDPDRHTDLVRAAAPWRPAALDMPVESLGFSPPVEVGAETPLRHVAEVLAGEVIGAVLVRATSGLVGIVSERDIVVAVAAGADLDAAVAADVMAESVVSVQAGEPLAAAAAAMAGRDVRHLPVISGGRAVGMVSARDVLVAIAPPAG